MQTRIHPRPHQGRRSGFSLAELMVVIVILGLLATFVAPRLMDRLGQAHETKAKVDITQIAEAVNVYQINNAGRLPDSLEMLIQEDENGQRYLDADDVPLDPWGNEYVFEPDFDGSGSFRVISYGADGAPGGEDKNADLDNRSIKSGRRRR